MPNLPELNPVVHGRLRLTLLSLLSGVQAAEFTWLRSKTEATDGNLGAQLLKLEEAGYVAAKKSSYCASRKPSIASPKPVAKLGRTLLCTQPSRLRKNVEFESIWQPGRA